jgi:hypothetical protein
LDWQLSFWLGLRFISSEARANSLRSIAVPCGEVIRASFPDVIKQGAPQETDVIRVVELEPLLASSLPITHTLLGSSNLTLHPIVSRVVLHGSRGPAGGYRPDSDIDLSLLVDFPAGITASELPVLLRKVLELVLNNWAGAIEADLAAVFDARNCGLKCFERTEWDAQLCKFGSVDCFGLYKIQKGFNGFVGNAGVQVKRMHPCLTIWQRS